MTFIVLETPHVVVAAAIAVKVANPALAIPLALGSHFILEKVPHWNPHWNTEKKKFGKVTKQTIILVLVDAGIAFVFGTYIAFLSLPNYVLAITILLSCLAGVLPDLIEAPYFFFDKKSRFINKWILFQKSIQVDTGVIPGLITQTLTVIAAVWWIFI